MNALARASQELVVREGRNGWKGWKGGREAKDIGNESQMPISARFFTRPGLGEVCGVEDTQ